MEKEYLRDVNNFNKEIVNIKDIVEQILVILRNIEKKEVEHIKGDGNFLTKDSSFLQRLIDDIEKEYYYENKIIENCERIIVLCNSFNDKNCDDKLLLKKIIACWNELSTNYENFFEKITTIKEEVQVLEKQSMSTNLSSTKENIIDSISEIDDNDPQKLFLIKDLLEKMKSGDLK